jgi:CHAT domain-containing protein
MTIVAINLGSWFLGEVIPYAGEWIALLISIGSLLVFVRSTQQLIGFRSWFRLLCFTWDIIRFGPPYGIQVVKSYERYVNNNFAKPNATIYFLLATICMQVQGERRYDFQKKALIYLQNSLETLDSKKQEATRSAVLNKMGDIYFSLPYGDRRANLLKARQLFLQFLEGYNAKKVRFDQEYFTLLVKLGHIHLLMPFRQEDDLHEATNYYKMAESYVGDDFQDSFYLSWTERIFSKHLITEINSWRVVDVYLNLATVYLCFLDSKFIIEADLLISKALKICSPSMNKEQYIRAQTIRGDILSSMGKNNDAITYYKEALNFCTPEEFPYQYASLQHKSGLWLRDDESIELKERFRISTLCFEEASKYFSIEFTPIESRQVRKDLGDNYLLQSKWKSAWDNYEQAIKISKYILEASMFSETKLEESGVSIELYHNASYVLSMMGRTIEGMLILEEGKALLLTEQLGLRLNRPNMVSESIWHRFATAANNFRQTWVSNWQIYSPDRNKKDNIESLTASYQKARNDLDTAIKAIKEQDESFLQNTSYADIIKLALTQDTHIVLFCITKVGSIAYIVYPNNDVNPLTVVYLPLFDTSVLTGILMSHDLRNRHRAKAKSVFFDAILGSLSNQLLIPILNRFSKISRKVLIIPTLQLSVFPFHACWYETDSKKHYLVDDYEFSYAPSITIVKRLQSELNARSHIAPFLLAIIDPTNDLPYTHLEKDSIVNFFDINQRVVLEGSSATWFTIKKYSLNCTYLHFACHGSHNFDNIVDSKLILANGVPLTLRSLFIENNFYNARLVVLSACESGLTDTIQALDEYIGLPAGFLYAGIPCVLGTLWPVDDRATSILMERFYHYHLVEGLAPSQALRKSQIWLRDSTRESLGGYYASFIRMDPALAMDQAIKMMTEGDMYEQPYAHPYFWAGFTIIGL